MRLVAADDYDDLSRRVAALVIGAVGDEPESVLVLPTGATPLGMFRQLASAAAAGTVDFAHARFVTLDDYAGIEATDRRRLLLWLKRELLDGIGVTDDRIVAFDPTAEPIAQAARVEAAITAWGGIDLAVMGSGRTAISVNEPGSAFDVPRRLRPERSAPTSRLLGHGSRRAPRGLHPRPRHASRRAAAGADRKRGAEAGHPCANATRTDRRGRAGHAPQDASARHGHRRPDGPFVLIRGRRRASRRTSASVRSATAGGCGAR